MLSPARHNEAELHADHPCFGCAVRERAVCGVLDSGDLAAYRRLGWALKLSPGQTLFHEGDPATRVFTVTRGTLKLYTLLPDGRRQVTGFMFPGDFLGISLDEEHAVSAEALGDVQLCWFPRSRFSEFVENHPAMERQLYCRAAHELAAAREQMVLLGRKTALERLATFFNQLLQRADRTGAGVASSFDLPMSRADIADYLGLTKETISRILGQLRDLRMIRLVTLDRIMVLDRAGLSLLAEGAGEAWTPEAARAGAILPYSKRPIPPATTACSSRRRPISGRSFPASDPAQYPDAHAGWADDPFFDVNSPGEPAEPEAGPD
jgi:CRP/FNR family transcriptional regulator